MEPDVAVYSRTLVVPSFLRGGVTAHGDDIVSTIVEVRAQIIGPRGVAASLVAKVEAIAEDLAVPEYSLKLDAYLLAVVLGRNPQMLSVPAN